MRTMDESKRLFEERYRAAERKRRFRRAYFAGLLIWAVIMAILWATRADAHPGHGTFPARDRLGYLHTHALKGSQRLFPPGYRPSSGPKMTADEARRIRGDKKFAADFARAKHPVKDEKFRTFTSHDKRYVTAAKLVTIHNKKVEIEKQGGKRVWVHLAKLSTEDRIYVAAVKKQLWKVATAPADAGGSPPVLVQGGRVRT